MSRVAHLIGALTGLKNPPTRRQPKRRKMVFEPLDQRLLLSGTPFYSAAGAQAAVHLTVQLSDINGTSTLQVVDSQQGVVASAAVNNLRGTLDIVGSRFGDTLTLASDLSRLSGKVTFSGGGGSDTLAGPRADTQWTISGSDAGSVDGLVFTGVARLAGADNNQDTDRKSVV